VPISYTVSYRTIEGGLGHTNVYANDTAHAITSAKELFPEIHRVTGVRLAPIWI